MVQRARCWCPEANHDPCRTMPRTGLHPSSRGRLAALRQTPRAA
jgi:hypothetical protein